MMGWIARFLKHKAVYWGSPSGDGRGGFTYDDPVELSCYWAKRQELFITAEGRQEVSRAIVHLSTEVEVGVWLWRGELSEVASSVDSPNDVSEAYQIRATAAVPSVSGQQTLYKAWL